MTPEEQIASVAEYPFGVTNSKDGFRVYRIKSVKPKGYVAIAVKRYDTTKDDPYLVADVLRETFDPDKDQSVVLTGFIAFFRNLEDAVAAIKKHEARYSWQRQHILDCKKEVETAKRRLYSAENAQTLNAWRELDCTEAVRMFQPA